jgi:hypothetical protein
MVCLCPLPCINHALDTVADMGVPVALLVTRTAFGRVCLLHLVNCSMPTSSVMEIVG